MKVKILKDRENNLVISFGLICLQSPVLKMPVRDNYLGIPGDKLDI
jgi:hypothetical protein